jgi:hypothetical protein
MKPAETPPTDTESTLPGAQFADAYAMTVTGQSLDAMTAANRAFGRAPAWINRLLQVRNALVAPFRLKAGELAISDPSTNVGIFPLLHRSENQIILGLDDRHLDFRLRVDVAELGQGRQSVTATTVVRTHNLFGRAYLQAVLPFHRLIVKTMLAQALRS